jgi:hypothetical protein
MTESPLVELSVVVAMEKHPAPPKGTAGLSKLFPNLPRHNGQSKQISLYVANQPCLLVG